MPHGRPSFAEGADDEASFPGKPAVYGTFTFEVSGQYAASDPDTIDSESLLGRMVTLQVAQLRK